MLVMPNEKRSATGDQDAPPAQAELTAIPPVGCTDLLGHTAKDEMLKKSLEIPDHKIMKRYDSF